MFKSSAGKLFFVFSLAFASSCNYGSVSQTNAPGQATFTVAELKNGIPFSTKEPEIYQTEIITQTFAGNEKSERKIFTARNGAKRITIFNAGEKYEIARLETGSDQAFSIYPDKKIYTEFSGDSHSLGENAGDFLTTEWLNQKTDAKFESLGTENNLSKFRVKLGDAENSNSEVLVFVDENFKIPVRQEFYSVKGDQRVLTFSVEMKNFKSEADEKLFEHPKDYRKVSAKQFQEILRQERRVEK